MVKDLNYWKENAKEDYASTPISVLKYISKLEEEKYSEEEVFNLIEKAIEDKYANLRYWFEQFKKK
jgi:hypothetical protein